MDERRCVVVQGTTRKRLRWIHSYTRDRNEWLLNVFYEVNISGIRNDISISSWERIEERLEIHDANRKGMIDLQDEEEKKEEEEEIRIKKYLIVDLLINAFSFFTTRMRSMMDIFVRFKYLSNIITRIIECYYTRNIVINVDNIAWNINAARETITIDRLS